MATTWRRSPAFSPAYSTFQRCVNPSHPETATWKQSKHRWCGCCWYVSKQTKVWGILPWRWPPAVSWWRRCSARWGWRAVSSSLCDPRSADPESYEPFGSPRYWRLSDFVPSTHFLLYWCSASTWAERLCPERKKKQTRENDAGHDVKTLWDRIFSLISENN